MREGLIPVDELHAYTKDNVPVTITGSLFYRATNSYKACFEAQDYYRAVQQLGTSAARAVIGQFEYDDINSDRNAINSSLCKIIDESCSSWGVTCTRFEIQDFRPQNDHVEKQLELQVAAERTRRENDLNTRSKLRTAEGEKEALVLKSEGELAATKNAADANKYRINAETDSRTRLIDETVRALGGNHEIASNYLIEMNKIEQLSAMATGPNNITYFLPTDLLSTIKRFSSCM